MHLDNNGTTFLLPEVRDKLQRLLAENIGNPASETIEGRNARELVESSRDNLAALLHCDSERIMFTSSGSEANATVIRSALRVTGRRKIVLSEIEHASLSSLAEALNEEGVEVRTVRVLPSGKVDEEDLLDAIDSNTAIVSVQMVNNETGVIQPYTTAASLAHLNGAIFHTDAAQAVGKIEFSAADTGADFLTLTGHKFHAPQGVGAIWSAGTWEHLSPLIPGGSQEYGRRGGTHNVLAIAGIGEAARVRKERLPNVIDYLTELRDLFESELFTRIPALMVNGDISNRVCNTSNLLFAQVDGKALYLRLLAQGLGCSQSSACTSNIPEPSRVLRAMGLSYDEAFSSIRFSFSELNTHSEAVQAAELIARNYSKIHALVAKGW